MQPSSTSFVERVLGAIRLDNAVYEEIERDQDATWQAAAVVVVVSVLSGLGATSGERGSIVFGVLGTLFFWALYALFAYVVGAYLLRVPETSASFGEVLRVLGFAYAPSAFGVLGFVPGIGPLIVIAAWIWSVVASVIALRQAFEVSTGRAVAIAIVAFVAMFVVLVLILTILGLGIASMFSLMERG